MTVLLAENLSKTFYTPHSLRILQSIHLSVQSGESIAITGRSGEGKSTLLHILGTLEAPTDGKLWINGLLTSSTPLPELRNKQVGFIFQSFHLLEDSSVIENVLMPAKIARLPTHSKSSAYDRARSLLDRVGLLPRAHFLSKQLSGGEKQRVALARALFNDPPLILADEPTGNLDKTNSQMVHQLLLELTQQSGKTLIVATHDLELAQLCDRQYTLKEGFLCTS